MRPYTTDVSTTPVRPAMAAPDGDPRDRLDGAVPSPSFAFLLTLITLSTLFWLVTFKRTTGFTEPEQWLLESVVQNLRQTVMEGAPGVDSALLAISALGSGWFVSLGFAAIGLAMLLIRRRDLAWLVALGTLAFPIEWALKYFTADPEISLAQLVAAMFNVGNIGLDDVADFPAGHALRATVFYGIAAFLVARLSARRGPGLMAYGAAVLLIVVISLIRIYLGAHFPIDVLGGWTAGMALLTIAVAWHVLQADDRMRARQQEAMRARRQEMLEQLRRRREATAAGEGSAERPPIPRARPRQVAQPPGHEA